MLPVAATNPVSFVPTVPVLPLDPVCSDNKTCYRKDMVHLTAAGATAVATAVAKAIFGDADNASALNTTTRWSEGGKRRNQNGGRRRGRQTSSRWFSALDKDIDATHRMTALQMCDYLRSRQNDVE